MLFPFVNNLFPGICGFECCFFHISVFRFLLLYFSRNAHEKLLYLWQVAWFFPLCALNLCLIVSYDISNQMLLTPSCYQQLMPKIFIVTLLSMQVRALQITEMEFPAIVLFFFFAYYTAKRMQNKRRFIRKWWLGKVL